MKLLSSLLKDSVTAYESNINKLISKINKTENNIKNNLLSIYHVPDIVLSALPLFTHLILIATYELSTVITAFYG